jgi:hypothetical protein
MKKTEQQKEESMAYLVIGLLCMLCSALCLIFGVRALEEISLPAVIHGGNPESVANLLVRLVVCLSVPGVLSFVLGMHFVSASTKSIVDCPTDWAPAAKKFVAAKLVVYQDLSDEACAKRIVELSATQGEGFKDAVVAELAALNFV